MAHLTHRPSQSAEKKKQREDIPAPAIAPGADAWQQGKSVQLSDPTGTGHSHPKGAQRRN